MLNDRLTKAYSEPIKNTLTEPSTSVVVRSEQQFHGMDRQRFAQRRHFYEVVHNGTPGDMSRFGAHCTPLDENDRLGVYLGFVDLRQHFEESPLALGLLAVPGHIREDANAFVIQGEYGPLFGTHSFRCTVYSMQDKAPTIGAQCAQMCAIMALGMLGDRRAEIKGSFTLTYLAWMASQRTIPHAIDPASLVDKERGEKPVGSFQAAGINPPRLRDVLRECNVGAEWIDLGYQAPSRVGDTAVSDRLAIRLIESYIFARFPVILSVDSRVWVEGEEGASKNETPTAHAVTIVGIRKIPGSREVSRLIVHDPGWKPFGERTLQNAFLAARHYDPLGPSNPKNHISMVPVTDKHIRKHPHKCIAWLLKEPHELAAFREYYLGQVDTDYDIRLLSRDSLVHVLAPSSLETDPGSLVRRHFPDSRFWAISTYSKGRRTMTWLFDAASKEGCYVAKLIWDEKNTLRALRYGGNHVFVAPI